MFFDRPAQRKQPGIWGVLIVAAIGVWLVGCGGGSGISAGGPTPTSPPLQMRQYENPAAFDILYPAAWSYMVPSEGLLIFEDARVSSLREPGQSLTVLRLSPIDVRGTLDDTLNHYLDNGPLRAGYTIDKEAIEITLDDQPARELLMRLPASEEQPGMVAYIAAAETESRAVYIFTGVAPVDEWERVKDRFVVMVRSVGFNE